MTFAETQARIFDRDPYSSLPSFWASLSKSRTEKIQSMFGDLLKTHEQNQEKSWLDQELIPVPNMEAWIEETVYSKIFPSENLYH
ncbi:hypothetical protein V6R21_26550 [Limibacter armeniacum]|uniref:hypothetical protein n=1 Tax=Limibacter armeniacum TaxID=466084 RepID=UPI002FE6B6C9